MTKLIIAGILAIIASGAVYRHQNNPNPSVPPTPRTEDSVSVPAINPGEYTYTITHDGVKRSYILHIPPQYNGKPTPLITIFHGGGGNMEQAKSYGWQEKSDESGFILALPNGSSRMPGDKLATWNAGDCCAYARDSEADDVGFVKAMLADIQTKVAIDTTRIYATGMSNGGMFSYRLACDMTGTFAAIAPIAGTDVTKACSPSQPISVLHIHALDDTHVLYNGGMGEDAFINPDTVTEFTSVPDTVQKWVNLNKLSNTPQRTLTVPGAYCDTYGTTGTEVMLCTTETGGHSVPGTTGEGARQPKTPSQAIVATDIVWEFFQKHTR